MNYHRRFQADGTSEIICTGCFQTVGVASSSTAAREIEAQHVCVANRQSEALLPPSFRYRASGQPDSPLAFRNKTSIFTSLTFLDMTRKLPFLYAAMVALIYALPTMMEWLASHRFNPWFAIILPGDLAGCFVLATIFKMPRRGAVLYISLAACKAVVYATHLVSAESLLWAVDVVPTLVVAGAIDHFRSGPTLQKTKPA